MKPIAESERKMNRKKTTIMDIAREAGVSNTTVSLCFQENSRISETTRKRVLEVAARKKYIPSHAAQNLRFGANNLIGIVVTDVINPFHARMLQIADRIAKRNNYRILFSQSHWQPNLEIESVRDLISHGVKGLLIFFNEKTRESYDLLLQTDIPHIAVDTSPSFYNGAYVVNNLWESGAIAANHLIHQGCKHFAYLGNQGKNNNFSYSSINSLANGFFETLSNLGVREEHIVTVPSGLSIEEGYTAFNKLINEYGYYDGIFCVNDLCAIGAIEAAKTTKLKVGEDIKIMGIDNLDISSLSSISLTTIEEPREEIMELAISKLIESFDSGKEPRVRESMVAKLIVRNSTKG